MPDSSRYRYLFLTEDAAQRAAAAGFSPSDIESETDRWCHGDCHELSLALQRQLGWPAWVFVHTESGTPIHSGVTMPDGRLLDMRGARSAEEMAEVCATFWGDGTIDHDVTRDDLSELAGLLGSGLEEHEALLFEDADLTIRQTLAVLVPELATALATAAQAPARRQVPPRAPRR